MGMGHAARALILGPRGYAHEPKGEEPSFMSLGPCGHDYYDYRERGKRSNKKGPRSLNLGPCGLIYSFLTNAIFVTSKMSTIFINELVFVFGTGKHSITKT